MPDTRDMPPRYTKSTLYLVSGLGAISLLFIAAGIADFHPLLGVFHWLAIVL
jgi:hypothetical protein